MSCPYVPTGRRRVDVEPPPDITGEHTQLSRDFEQLLPSCDKVREALDACREEVSGSGSGHCLEPSRAWRACYDSRSRVSQLIIRQCGGPLSKQGQQRSHGQLQADYAECVAAASKGLPLSATAQAECLGPLRQFLQCAQGVAIGKS